MDSLRALIYAELAEALSSDGPPIWMEEAGCEWPLYDYLKQLVDESSHVSPAFQQVVQALAQIPAELGKQRAARYQALFAGGGRPPIWLYESAYLSGRLFGPETIAVEKWYRAAGLQEAGPELPDHAALELSFLAYLAGMENGIKFEQAFLTQHAGRWLPEVGRRLAASGDLVYGPVGGLLSGWISHNLQPPRQLVTRRVYKKRIIPTIPRPEDCSLCGFCARVCPAKALTICDTKTETVLVLYSSNCTGCGRCTRACEFHAIQMAPASTLKTSREGPGEAILCKAPLVACLQCGEVIASQAEMAFLRTRLEAPAWLGICPGCRADLYEVVR